MDIYSLASLNQTTNFKLSASVPNLAARVSWAAIEPSPGVYDFSTIEAALAASKGLTSLRVLLGTFCPSWLVCQRVVGLPVPWDHNFAVALNPLIKALGAANFPLSHLCLNPDTGTSGEFRLDEGTLAQWQAVGYTPNVLENNFKTWVGVVEGHVASPLFVSWVPGGPTKAFDPANSLAINAALLGWFAGGNMNNGATPSWYMNFAMPFGYQALSAFGSGVTGFIANAPSATEFIEVYPSDVQYVTG